jgi:hypothetical protein
VKGRRPAATTAVDGRTEPDENRWPRRPDRQGRPQHSLWDQLNAITHDLAPPTRCSGAARSTVPSSMWTQRGGRHGTATPARSGACTRRRSRAIGSCRANPAKKAARVSPESGTHGRKSRGIVSFCARFAAPTRISLRHHCTPARDSSL